MEPKPNVKQDSLEKAVRVDSTDDYTNNSHHRKLQLEDQDATSFKVVQTKKDAAKPLVSKENLKLEIKRKNVNHGWIQIHKDKNELKKNIVLCLNDYEDQAFKRDHLIVTYETVDDYDDQDSNTKAALEDLGKTKYANELAGEFKKEKEQVKRKENVKHDRILKLEDEIDSGEPYQPQTNSRQRKLKNENNTSNPDQDFHKNTKEPDMYADNTKHKKAAHVSDNAELEKDNDLETEVKYKSKTKVKARIIVPSGQIEIMDASFGIVISNTTRVEFGQKDVNKNKNDNGESNNYLWNVTNLAENDDVENRIRKINIGIVKIEPECIVEKAKRVQTQKESAEEEEVVEVVMRKAKGHVQSSINVQSQSKNRKKKEKEDVSENKSKD